MEDARERPLEKLETVFVGGKGKCIREQVYGNVTRVDKPAGVR